MYSEHWEKPSTLNDIYLLQSSSSIYWIKEISGTMEQMQWKAGQKLESFLIV